MKKVITKFSLMVLGLTFVSSCHYLRDFEGKAERINNYEKAAIQLANENQQLRIKVSELEYLIQEQKSEISFLKLKLEKEQKGFEEPNGPLIVDPENDLVKFSTYKWAPSQIIAMGNTAMAEKNFEKAAQFFQTFVVNFKGHEAINDELLYKAGFSAFESGKYFSWVDSNLTTLITKYPTSKYYRKAKLWIALSNLKEGKTDKFFATVEEFRKKYRNSPEWKIMSTHYETIVQKFKK